MIHSYMRFGGGILSLFLAATKQLYEHPCPSVRSSHLFLTMSFSFIIMQFNSGAINSDKK